MAAHDRPDRRSYHRIERERRFLLAELPAGLDPEEFRRLHDRLLEDAPLRIRRVETPAGDEVVTKLAQKIPDPEAPEDPRRRRMTTIYLAPGEGVALAALEGRRSTKRRHTLVHEGFTWAIDVWEEPAAVAGLVMAEVETDDDAGLESLVPPAWCLREVTRDPAYSSFRLSSGEPPPPTETPYPS